MAVDSSRGIWLHRHLVDMTWYGADLRQRRDACFRLGKLRSEEIRLVILGRRRPVRRSREAPPTCKPPNRALGAKS